MRFCDSCGSQINDDDTMCPFCGAAQGDQSGYGQNQSGYGQNQSGYGQNRQGYGQNSYAVSEQAQREQKQEERSRNVQETLSRLPLSPGFIVSAVSGTVLMLVALIVFFLCFAAHPLIGIVFGIIVLPLNIFAIGQIIFIINGATKKEYMHTSGLTVMNVGVVMKEVYEIIAIVIYFFSNIFTLSKVSSYSREARSVGLSSQYQSAVGLVWLIILLCITVMVLSAMSYAKASDILKTLKRIQISQFIPNGNLSIFPIVIFFIRSVVLLILAILSFVSSTLYSGVLRSLSAVSTAIGVYILFMAIFYLISGIAIISANGKLAKCRFETR